MVAIILSVVFCAAFSAASPLVPRVVASLDAAGTAEAQQRDATATRAFSNIQVKTSDGRCLFVDKLSGDSRSNLTPVQVAACGSTDGQGWDIITKGKHNDQAGQMLVVSTLTNACLNFDPRRAAGNQVILFSCGGRADGGGDVTTSQLYAFTGGAGPLQFKPLNAATSCLVTKGNVVDVDNACTDAATQFTFGGAAAAGGNNDGDKNTTTTAATISAASTQASQTVDKQTATKQTTAKQTGAKQSDTNQTEAKKTDAQSSAKETRATATSDANPQCTQDVRTVTVFADATDTVGADVKNGAKRTSAVEMAASSSSSFSIATTASAAATTEVTSGSAAGGKAIPNPTEKVPVSGAGTNLNPTAAAEAQPRDDNATRAFSNVEIRAPNGQCLFVDPTAGDFRQNLIPVSLVACGGTPNEKWDIISKGKHNDQPNSALIVSTLMNGCISLDPRKVGIEVHMFSCGGRADGSGQVTSSQLMPFIGEESIPFAPEGENNVTCILPGDGKLVKGDCPKDLGAQLYSVFPKLK